MNVLINPAKRFAAGLAIGAAALSPAAMPVAAANATTAAQATKLHAGEFCTKSRQGYYHRHGYTCRRASDGRLRLFTL
jgi:hypothetical protein